MHDLAVVICHTHSLSQPEFPERMKLENPDAGPNPRHPLHVINFSPKHLQGSSLCIILGKTEKTVTQIFFCSLWFRRGIQGEKGKGGRGLLCPLLSQDLHLVSLHCLGLFSLKPRPPLPSSLLLIL